MQGGRGKDMPEDKGKSDGRGKGDGKGKGQSEYKAALAASEKARWAGTDSWGSGWGSASWGGSWGTWWPASGSWKDSGCAGATAEVEPDITSSFCWLATGIPRRAGGEPRS